MALVVLHTDLRLGLSSQRLPAHRRRLRRLGAACTDRAIAAIPAELRVRVADPGLEPLGRPAPWHTSAVILTPEERQAQRVIVGLIRGGASALDDQGWRVWRHPEAGEWQASAHEISDHLETLGVPYSVEIVRRRWGSSRQVIPGYQVRVATADLPVLLRWAPSLQKLIDALAGPLE